MSDQYILNDKGEPVLEPDLMTWARWLETRDRTLKQTKIKGGFISTIFLGLDHNFGEGEPVLWETMVFGGEFDRRQDRCSGTKEDALAMHNKMIKKVSFKKKIL